ncbi:uncharacterized protein HHUB_2377 [Halobacterium hubeiense]|jgi:hypothetical protein|uniref:Uncharacterized protein n=2 Tax=Halobacterium TaxID=2239 RepID=A0A0U5H365_9EURY|nr:hypothetical protein [Halobacterium hubeiense]CQH56410.1 uncharacterized protein HHUB_2377 [Halobacterium hubeiense]
MTTDFTPDDGLSNTADFEAALGRVLLAARRNDIDPRGAWEYRSDDPGPDVEVVVVELAE